MTDIAWNEPLPDPDCPPSVLNAEHVWVAQNNVSDEEGVIYTCRKCSVVVQVWGDY